MDGCLAWAISCPGLYWFAVALLTDPEKFAWMIPFAVLGLPAFFSLYYAGATLAVWFLPKRIGWQVPGLALAFLVAEWLRGNLLTGFPWNPISLGWSFSLPMFQAASLVGSYGLIFFTLLLAMLPVALLWPRISQREKNRALVLCLLLLVGMFGYGVQRLATNPQRLTPTVLRIVQADIGQASKYEPDWRLRNLRREVDFSRAPGWEKVDAFIWSESAFPVPLVAETPLLRSVMEFLPERARLITGATRLEGTPQDFVPYNSLFLVNRRAQVEGFYDKIKLVPFGEFMPLRSIIPINSVTNGMMDFGEGKAVPLLQSGALPPFNPQICYEAIFPELAPRLSGAKWIVNVTNDAWFGTSVGPYQHYNMTRMRGVEQGLPVARAANSGISAVLDGYGREVGKLPLGRAGILTANLPAANAEPTLYSRLSGWMIFAVCSAVALFCRWWLEQGRRGK